jgi:NADH-quinone oxidoreductase subunit M
MLYLPLVGALLIFFLPRASETLPRTVALLCAIGSLLLSIVMLVGFNTAAPFEDGVTVPFEERLEWGSGLGVSYFLGVDGIAVPLIVLTTALTLIAIIWSWDTVNSRRREYYIALLLLETGMLGVFMALDLFVFYIFWELMLIPMALLIGIWGSDNRVYAAVKFFLYTLFGSLLMLVGIIATYQAYYLETGERTLNVLKLQEGNYGSTFQFWVFAAFFIAFAVKVPLFPFHTWLPDAHVQAPTAASVILAAVMLKMGGYGLLRFNLPLYEEGTLMWQPWVIGLSVVAILSGALVALVQPDMKKLIAYSSVSHMAFVTLGIFVLNLQGMNGSMLVMLAHGFNTGALFLLVGVIYERAHTRQISAFGGLATKMPAYSAYFTLFMFASIGLPGLSGFVGEFLVALGTWQYNPLLALFTFAVVIFAAWYMMWMIQRVIFGRAKDELPDPHDNALTDEERAMLAAAGDGHGHGHAAQGHGAMPLPVSGGSEYQDAHVPALHDHEHGTGDDEHTGTVWPDLTKKEALTLFPLAVATVIFGIFPGLVLRYVQPAFERILAMYQ